MPLLEEFYRRRNQILEDTAKQILFSVIGDLTDRKGFDNAWDDIGEETREEILQTNLEIINKWIWLVPPKP